MQPITGSPPNVNTGDRRPNMLDVIIPKYSQARGGSRNLLEGGPKSGRSLKLGAEKKKPGGRRPIMGTKS